MSLDCPVPLAGADMTLRELEAGALSSSLITWLGVYDWWGRGGGINLLVAGFGGIFFVGFVVHAVRERRKR